jgi:succinyl-diaminopimelate desuccinylase
MQPRPTLRTILDDLVRVPSVTGQHGAAKKVIEVAAGHARAAGIAHIVVDESGGYPYLLATTRPANDGMLWFACHLDVVPGSDDLFSVREDDANYYGRGVFDMKGMVAGILAALYRLPNVGETNVGLLFTTDEEVGGKNGVGALVDDTFKGAGVIVFDQSFDWVLQERMKGVLWLRFTAKGKTAHGARPWLGQNANQALVGFLHEMQAWFEREMPHDHPDHYDTTYNLGTMQGGEATNQVPAAAQATADVRFVSEDDATKVLEGARAIAKKHGVDVEEWMHEPCADTDLDSYWYKKTVELMAKLKIVPGPKGERFGHGSTDGRFFAPYAIPTITTRPPGGAQHSEAEWVSKEGLAQVEELAYHLILATNR